MPRPARYDGHACPDRMRRVGCEQWPAAVFLAATLAISARATEIRLWPVDPLVKVFRDATPAADPATAQADPAALAEVARGEHASLQAVAWSDAALHGLRAEIDEFRLQAPPAAPSAAAGGPPRPPGTADTRLPAARVRFVGYVPVDRPMQEPPPDVLRVAPADFPDPLLELDRIDVPPRQAQPIWITFRIPLDAPPGEYRATLRVQADIPKPTREGGADAGEQPPVATQPVVEAELALRIRVYPVTIDRTRLWLTNWFSPHARHMQISPAADSPEFYALLARYARNMAEHRQNVALISPLSLADFGVGPDGQLTIGFARFDRWVEVFREAGVIGRIEGGHLGGRAAGWESPFRAEIRRAQDGTVLAEGVEPDSPAADAFYLQFLPALVAHLKERGWFDIYMQHLADEPIPANLASYRALASQVRRHAPGLRIIEACHAKDLTGSIDIWVPQLNFLHRDREHYRTRQAAGDEVWFYTCVFPQGAYANRFIELPLIKTRLLHWLNFRYGVTGYLHWGYNQWADEDPFTHTTRKHPGPPYLPAGDAWIVYPGRDGPLDSLRWEALRDGVVDHELLCRLAERDASVARGLAERFILDFDRYDTDVQRFRAARRELLERLSP